MEDPNHITLTLTLALALALTLSLPLSLSLSLTPNPNQVGVESEAGRAHGMGEEPSGPVRRGGVRVRRVRPCDRVPRGVPPLAIRPVVAALPDRGEYVRDTARLRRARPARVVPQPRTEAGRGQDRGQHALGKVG